MPADKGRVRMLYRGSYHFKVENELWCYLKGPSSCSKGREVAARLNNSLKILCKFIGNQLPYESGNFVTLGRVLLFFPPQWQIVAGRTRYEYGKVKLKVLRGSAAALTYSTT